jgi:hypothetical protein
MNKLQKLALLYLLLVIALIYGYAVGRLGAFPASHIEKLLAEVQAFSKGDAREKKTSLVGKLKNDLGISFERLLYPYPNTASAKTRPVDHPSLSSRRDSPLVYIAPGHREGYRVVVGALALEGSFWGALLLSPEGQILHSWKLSTSHLPTNKLAGRMKNLYGAHIFADGSVIFNMQEDGGGIVKVDACSQPVWQLPGDFHHVVSPTDHGNFWTFNGSMTHFNQDLALVSVATGNIVNTISMSKVRAANPDLYIWDLQHHGFRNVADMKSRGDMTHGNDIEPLSVDLAASFPAFEPGDLLISYATTNLVFVLDPATLKVKWWRVGITDFQHDPDWEPGGDIVIFSNNWRTGVYSDIVAINPADSQHRVILGGKKYDFRKGINGNHQRTAFGTRMITSAQQGWTFEVDDTGRRVFSFVNNVDSDSREAMHLSESWRFEEGYFQSSFWETCPD